MEDLPERNFALPLVSQLEQSSTVPTIPVRNRSFQFSVHFLLPLIFPISSAFYVYFFKYSNLRWRNFPTFARERCLHSFLFEVHSSTSPALIFLCLRCHFNFVFFMVQQDALFLLHLLSYKTIFTCCPASP